MQFFGQILTFFGGIFENKVFWQNLKKWIIFRGGDYKKRIKKRMIFGHFFVFVNFFGRGKEDIAPFLVLLTTNHEVSCPKFSIFAIHYSFSKNSWKFKWFYPCATSSYLCFSTFSLVRFKNYEIHYNSRTFAPSTKRKFVQKRRHFTHKKLPSTLCLSTLSMTISGGMLWCWYRQWKAGHVASSCQIALEMVREHDKAQKNLIPESHPNLVRLSPKTS